MIPSMTFSVGATSFARMLDASEESASLALGIVESCNQGNFVESHVDSPSRSDPMQAI